MRLSLAVALLLLAGCSRLSCAEAPPPASRVVEVPRTPLPPRKVPPLLNGERWSISYHADPFVDAHGLKQPHTHLQFMADDTNLYVGYYAADEDLRTKPRPTDPRGSVGDRFTLKIGPMEIVLNPKGGTVPPGVELETDVDGTVDVSNNEDEEWLEQLSIPWALLGPRAKEDGVLIRALRTDAPRRESERALAWPADGFARLVFKSASQ